MRVDNKYDMHKKENKRIGAKGGTGCFGCSNKKSRLDNSAKLKGEDNRGELDGPGQRLSDPKRHYNNRDGNLSNSQKMYRTMYVVQRRRYSTKGGS